MQLLVQHSWPGNIRELEHAVERAVLLANGGVIHTSDLSLNPGTKKPQDIDVLSLEEVEQVLIQKALAHFDGNVSRAAEALGINRGASLRNRMKYPG